MCVCICACGGDPPFSRMENYGECDDISVGVTGTKPHLLVGMCVEWKSLSLGLHYIYTSEAQALSVTYARIKSVVYGSNAENEPVSRIKMADYRALGML